MLVHSEVVFYLYLKKNTDIFIENAPPDTQHITLLFTQTLDACTANCHNIFTHIVSKYPYITIKSLGFLSHTNTRSEDDYSGENPILRKYSYNTESGQVFRKGT